MNRTCTSLTKNNKTKKTIKTFSWIWSHTTCHALLPRIASTQATPTHVIHMYVHVHTCMCVHLTLDGRTLIYTSPSTLVVFLGDNDDFPILLPLFLQTQYTHVSRDPFRYRNKTRAYTSSICFNKASTRLPKRSMDFTSTKLPVNAIKCIDITVKHSTTTSMQCNHSPPGR